METDTDNMDQSLKLKPLSNFDRKYTQYELVGKGHFGEVYKVQENLTGKWFASKVVSF